MFRVVGEIRKERGSTTIAWRAMIADQCQRAAPVIHRVPRGILYCGVQSLTVRLPVLSTEAPRCGIKNLGLLWLLERRGVVPQLTQIGLQNKEHTPPHAYPSQVEVSIANKITPFFWVNCYTEYQPKEIVF